MLAQKKFDDERLENTKNKITTEWFIGIYYFCLISMIAKFFYFDLDVGQCSTELFLIILTPVYFYVRSRQIGVVFPEDKRRKKRIIVILILFAIAWIALAGWAGGVKGILNWIVTLIIYGFIAIAIGGIIVPQEKARKKLLEEQWDDD